MSMILQKHDKSFITDEQGSPAIIEHVQYGRTIDAFGNVMPHRIVLDRVNAPDYPMPDGTVKTTAEVIADIGG